MEARLIYNPNSGATDQIDPQDLVERLSEAGYQPLYEATTNEEDLDRLLEGDEGLVVAAGGDGTVRAVATRLIGRGVPLAIVPSGTANNIARSLGIEGDPLEIISRLSEPLRCRFDVGQLRGPWGKDFFLEAAGYGLYAATLATYRPENGKSILRSIEAVLQTLEHFRPVNHALKLDGQDISGTYLFVEVLNTPAFGPRIKAAPDADPSDGLFEVVRVREDKRAGFLQYLTSLLREELDELPNVEVSRGRKLEIGWTGFPLHVDAEVRPPGYEPPDSDLDEGKYEAAIKTTPGHNGPGISEVSTIEMEVLPGSLEIWLPKPGDEEE